MIGVQGADARARLAAGLAGYALGAPLGEIFSEGRGSDRASAARQLAMYLVHTSFSMSLQRVAIAFRRDRSTVAHAVRQVEDRREEPAFDEMVAALEAMLEAAPCAREAIEEAAA